MAGKRKKEEGAIERRVAIRRRRARAEGMETIRLLRERVIRCQRQLDELLAKKEEEMKVNETEKGKEKEEEEEEEEEEELEDGYTLDNDPSGAQCSRPGRANERNHDKWQRYKEIFSLYYAENGDLKIPQLYEHQGVKIGQILAKIRRHGSYVKDNPRRKQWLLEKGISFTYDSLYSWTEEKWQRYKEIFSLYYAENGDLRMPESYQHQGVKIGQILSGIRWQGHFVKDNPQRKQWLLERGVILTYDSGLRLSDTMSVEKWHRYKEIFSLYFAENGDLNIPSSYVFQGVKIGKILSIIRHEGCYVRDNAPRKQWLLEKGVSFTYDSVLKSSREEKWQRYKEIFSFFYAENGDLKIPAKYEYQGIKIGTVLSGIRRQGFFVKGHPQRKQWLLEKGVLFTYDSEKSSPEEKWQRYQEIFSLYFAENGHLKIPQKYQYQGIKIGLVLYNIRCHGDWVRDNLQRKQWLLEKGVILTYDSGLRLSDTMLVEKWQRYKEMFSLYYAEHGDLRIPISYVHQGVKIGKILHDIRHHGSFVKDNPQRKQWLLERGVILTYDSGLYLSDTTSVKKWQRYKEIFSLYFAENGDLNIPQRYEMQGVKIGQILQNIRSHGSYVRDNAPRKQWLLEKGVSFTYDSVNSSSEENGNCSQ